MGLDVGVVSIKYLERPDQPIYDFLWQVAEYDSQNWGEVWDGNAILETTRSWMLNKARKYIRDNRVTKEDADKVVAWVRGLPWVGGTIMLHLGW